MDQVRGKSMVAGAATTLSLTLAWRKVALDKWGTEKNVPLLPALIVPAGIIVAGLFATGATASFLSRNSDYPLLKNKLQEKEEMRRIKAISKLTEEAGERMQAKIRNMKPIKITMEDF